MAGPAKFVGSQRLKNRITGHPPYHHSISAIGALIVLVASGWWQIGFWKNASHNRDHGPPRPTVHR